jgi:hypothetical protein
MFIKTEGEFVLRESSKIALGGIISALAVVIMLSTYITPLLVYTAPPFAGLLLVVMLREIGYSWAFGAYTAVSLLSVFLVADKESAVFFMMFFGYYPILRMFINSKIKIKPLSFAMGFVVFNCSLYLSVKICSEIFGIDYSDFTDGGTAMFILFIVLMNFVFIAYDVLLNRAVYIYDMMISKKVKKLFRH